MYNKCIFLGRICTDLELKQTPTGVNVLTFRLAVDRSYQVKGEERKSNFFTVVAWRQNAVFINNYFSKGRMILIEGKMETRQYKDKNGFDRTSFELIVDKAHFTGESKQTETGEKNEEAPLPDDYQLPTE